MSIYNFNWTHEKWCRPSDPINIVFEGITLDDIERFLLSRGWKSGDTLTFAFSHFVPFPKTNSKKPQDRQFIGAGKFCLLSRYHIRLWQIEQHIFAGVHRDAFRFAGHTATDFESIEKFFAEECKNNPDWEVKVDCINLDNRLCGYKEPFNNGLATLIRRK